MGTTTNMGQENSRQRTSHLRNDECTKQDDCAKTVEGAGAGTGTYSSEPPPPPYAQHDPSVERGQGLFSDYRGPLPSADVKSNAMLQQEQMGLLQQGQASYAQPQQEYVPQGYPAHQGYSFRRDGQYRGPLPPPNHLQNQQMAMLMQGQQQRIQTPSSGPPVHYHYRDNGHFNDYHGPLPTANASRNEVLQQQQMVMLMQGQQHQMQTTSAGPPVHYQYRGRISTSGTVSHGQASAHACANHNSR